MARPKPRAWGRFIEALAACACLRQLLMGKPGSVVLNGDRRLLSGSRCGDPHLAPRPFAGVLDEVAQHLRQVLILATDEQDRVWSLHPDAAIRTKPP
jgi:hypothetical protein